MNLNATFFKLTLFALALAILGCLFSHMAIVAAWGFTRVLLKVLTYLMGFSALGIVLYAFWISVKNKEDENTN